MHPRNNLVRVSSYIKPVELSYQQNLKGNPYKCVSMYSYINYIYVYVYICIYICVHAYIYIYTHIHIYALCLRGFFASAVSLDPVVLPGSKL